MQAAIAAFGLSKQFPTGNGLYGVSFEVPPGEIVALIGPSSSGKSTLLKLLATRLPLTQGSFAILGHRVPDYRAPADAVSAVRRRVGALLEEAPVAGDLTGWENAFLLGRLHGLHRQEVEHRLHILFDWAGLTAHARRPARVYSYPMRRKLGLIGALLHDPRVLLLDEPFHGLDMQARSALHGALVDLRRKGACIVIASSDLVEMRLLATRAILLDGGRVVAEGPAPALLQSLGRWSAVEVRLAGTFTMPDLSGLPGLCAPPEYVHGGLRVRVADPDATLAPLLAILTGAGARVHSVEIRRPEVGHRP